MKKFFRVLFPLLLSSLFLGGCSEQQSFLPDVFSGPTVSQDEQNSEDESSVSIYVETRADYIARIDGYERKYYVRKLSDHQLKYFSIIYDQVKNFQTNIDFGANIQADDLDLLLYLLNYDCPELIQINGDYAPKYVNEAHTIVSGVVLSASMDSEFYTAAVHKLNSTAQSIEKKLEDKTDAEREKFVYDYIFNNTVYNEVSSHAGSVYGVLVEHKGRCEGMSKAFMWMMNRLGYECICVVGKPLWQNESVFDTHCWNIVRLDDQYYHVDITADNINLTAPNNNPPTYGFYNVCDDFIYTSRTPEKIFDEMGIPECTDNTKDYHKRHRLYIPKKETEQEVKTAFYQILTDRTVNDEIHNIPIKLEDKDNYDALVEKYNQYLHDYLIEHYTEPYEYTVFSNNISQTVIVNAVLQNPPPEPSSSSDSLSSPEDSASELPQEQSSSDEETETVSAEDTVETS